ncbi:hypothetical protein GE061_012768 [Apolygus lucorum]|uniref:Peptidase S1 domain-containing protein n=1 Tax=Apolygus lucorum TaxID=248454 RepID=A0A8S9XTH8_APOLU|nr:hypothetical protein GE061_012768 [Apolygus lucorum]
MPKRLSYLFLVGFLSLGPLVTECARKPQQSWTEQYEFDPELYIQWTTPAPKDEKITWGYSLGAQWVGNLYAGRTEFPWIVDIRYENFDQEFWGIGNLISYVHVLTTCHTVAHFYHLENERFKNFQSQTKKDFTLRYGQRFRPNLKISYCTTYLWMDYEISDKWGHLEKDFESDVIEAGTRLAEEVFLHPECRNDSTYHDLAMIRLQTPIYPWPPIIVYMPIAMKWSTMEIPIADLSLQLERKMICYVASYGRSYANIVHHRAVDYKVKFRVYHERLRLCFTAFDKFPEQHRRPPRLWNPTEAEIMCFMTRARVGAVCNHDHGAPLVCEGEVYGIVIIGADINYCSDLIAMPFFVLRATQFKDYYLDVLKTIYPLKTRKFGSSASSPLISHLPPYIIYLSLVLPFITGLPHYHY